MKRNYGLDVARILAIFFVIMAHVYTDTYDLSNLGLHNIPVNKIWFGYLGFTLGRLGVPIFLMLTGYFLLSRKWTSTKISRFFHKNFIHLLITWEIWLFLYFMYSKYYLEQKIGGGTYLRQALFVEKVQLPNAWYMPLILGIYLFLPYVAIALEQINDKYLLLIMAILYGYLFLVPTINQFAALSHHIILENQLELSYGGGYCAFYILIGYCINRFSLQFKTLIQKVSGTLVALLLLSITVLFQVVCYRAGKNYNVWYDFATLPLISAIIFIFFEKWQLHVKNNILTKISDCSFGIFLIHYPILTVITTTVIHYQQSFIFLLGLTIIVYLISLLIVFVINRYQKIGTLLFFK